ncbi:unnamed protein product [Callosobruchus maculatus]|uniref:Uncharacterized protein n=1 Tax=Callosobruchus maculatus TaxID=64391 RepID=A0A653DTZ2_CALMS|nr:unnamed protein product [Callosobruchus maculatus]
MEDKHSWNENQVINASSKEETTEAMHPQSESADPTDLDELDNLQLQVSTIVVKKDSIELTHEKSEHSWPKRYSLANYVELKRDNQCYENLGGKSEDRCGKRGHKHHSISMNPTRSNMNKLFKKISFSAKTCRCTNSRCDCYNVVQPGISGLPGENADKQEDKPNGTESDFESEVYADSWKERSLGCDSEKDSMNVIMAIHGTDKKMADDSSSAASQFLVFNGP